jgi:mannitol/fructose-specific phosphotransferase system IIA component (Ntr-type)
MRSFFTITSSMVTEFTTAVAPAATLADYTRRELIVPRLREGDTAGIINELSQVLQRQGAVPDILPFYQAALNQELLANSALECGLAIPHARSGGIRQLQFAFGRVTAPIVWGAGTSCRVQFVFLLAVPATDAANYLHLLASLARLGKHPEILAQLSAAETATAIRAALRQIPLRQG